MLHKSFVPNLYKIEIEITTACNLYCLNCDRSSRQAPSNEHMSLEQIEKFVNESIELNWSWKEIRLIGGEPTLHPKIFDLVKTIKKYKNFNPNCKISIHTNGFGDKVKNILSKLPYWITRVNSAKTSQVNLFSSYNIAPIDLEEYKNADFTTACWIPENCGIGLTRYGYYPCGAGASVDRIFGFDSGIKNLSEVNISKFKAKLKFLCSYCGHFKDTDYDDPNYKEKWTTEEKMSISWQKAYKSYKKKKPSLSLY